MIEKVEPRVAKAQKTDKRRRRATDKVPTHDHGMSVARYFTRPGVDPARIAVWGESFVPPDAGPAGFDAASYAVKAAPASSQAVDPSPASRMNSCRVSVQITALMPPSVV